MEAKAQRAVGPWKQLGKVRQAPRLQSEGSTFRPRCITDPRSLSVLLICRVEVGAPSKVFLLPWYPELRNFLSTQ